LLPLAEIAATEATDFSEARMAAVLEHSDISPVTFEIAGLDGALRFLR
jgi:hypothetical protein